MDFWLFDRVVSDKIGDQVFYSDKEECVWSNENYWYINLMDF